MNGTPSSQIQILAPFRAALEWMKTMLFQPFDFAKWLTVAFAAFIGGHWGSNFSFRYSRSWPGDWKYRFSRHGDLSGGLDLAPWLIGLAVVAVLFAVALGIAWLWVTCRGRFIFTDCLVKNRGAIAEPWREFRREGNSFFLFSLVVGFCFFVLLALIALCVWLVFGVLFGDRQSGGADVAIIIVIVVGVLFCIILSIFFGLVSNFMIPVMYRRRCTAREAFSDVVKLVCAYPGPFVLFALFSLVLMIAVSVIATTVACLTCCIGALPYISTVILLPAIVWLGTYRLLFIRQFGDAYDVWANVAAPVQAAEPLPPSAPGAAT